MLSTFVMIEVGERFHRKDKPELVFRKVNVLTDLENGRQYNAISIGTADLYWFANHRHVEYVVLSST